MKLKSLSRLLPLVVGSAVAGVLASMSPAHALTYNWSFSGLANTSGTFDVTGNTITGISGSVGGTPIGSLLGAGVWSGNDNQFPLNVNGVSFTNIGGIKYKLAMEQSVQGTLTYQSDDDILPFVDDQGNTTTNQITTNQITTSQYIGATLMNDQNNSWRGAFSAEAVPFDNIPGGATIPAVGSLLALGAMRKVRKSIASKTRIANPVVAVRS